MFVTEEKSVFMGLTTRDNLRVADADLDAALALFPELERRLDVRGGLLSGGEQQMLSLARGLCREPRVLLADELSMGLAPLVVKRLLQAVRDAADRGARRSCSSSSTCARRCGTPTARTSCAGAASHWPGSAVELAGRISEIEDSYLTRSALREEV